VPPEPGALLPGVIISTISLRRGSYGAAAVVPPEPGALLPGVIISTISGRNHLLPSL